MHLCNNKLCCNPYHLHNGTQAENLAHAGACRKMSRTASRHGLTDRQMLYVRESSKSCRALARELGIGCHKTISRIRNTT